MRLYPHVSRGLLRPRMYVYEWLQRTLTRGRSFLSLIGVGSGQEEEADGGRRVRTYIQISWHSSAQATAYASGAQPTKVPQ